VSWNGIPSDRFAGGFSAFGLNIRVDGSAATSLSHPPDRPQPNDPKIDLCVHLLGAKKINGQVLEAASRSHGAKTLLFRSLRTSVGTLQRFSSESPRGCAEFVLNHQAREMWVSWSEEAPLEEVLSVLFNSMLAWVVRLSGGTCLHASVVARNGRAIAFVAPSGFGKSTIAASLIERGYAGMTDDAAALSRHDQMLLVHPGMPQLGLRSPSLEALPKFRAETSTVTDDKRRFELKPTNSKKGLRFENRPLPLAAIYFLRRSALAKGPEISAAKSADALLKLMGSLYPTSSKPLKDERLAKQLSQLSFVVQNVSCRHLIIPDTLATLPSVSDRVIEDLATLQAA